MDYDEFIVLDLPDLEKNDLQVDIKSHNVIITEKNIIEKPANN